MADGHPATRPLHSVTAPMRSNTVLQQTPQLTSAAQLAVDCPQAQHQLRTKRSQTATRLMSSNPLPVRGVSGSAALHSRRRLRMPQHLTARRLIAALCRSSTIEDQQRMAQ